MDSRRPHVDNKSGKPFKDHREATELAAMKKEGGGHVTSSKPIKSRVELDQIRRQQARWRETFEDAEEEGAEERSVAAEL